MSDNKPIRYGLDAGVFGLKVVTLHLEGKSVKSISEILSTDLGEKVSHRQVSNLLKSPECQVIMRDLNDAAMATAKALARQRAAKMIDGAFDVIEFHLRKKNLNAVPIVLKVAGVDVAEEAKTQSPVMNIIMPGAEKEAIDVVATESIPDASKD